MGMDQYLLIPFLMGWTSIYQLFWCSPGVQGFDTLPYLNLTLHSYGGDIFVAGWERWDCSLSSLPRASHTKLRIWKSVQDRKLSWTWIPQNKDSSPTVSMSNPQHFDTKDPMIQCSRQNTSMSINSRCVRALCCFVSQGRMHFPVTSYCFHTTQWHISFLDIFWISFGLFHVFLWHTMAYHGCFHCFQPWLSSLGSSWVIKKAVMAKPSRPAARCQWNQLRFVICLWDFCNI